MSREKLAEDQDELLQELKPGTQLLQGQYTIVKFINSGGFGITYLAKDSLDRDVVIKECFPGAFCHRNLTTVQPRSRTVAKEFGTVVRLFLQEAKSLSKLVHPNIVGVHQVFEYNETAYMAMDYIEGPDLLEIIETNRASLTPAKIVAMLKKLLGAVAFVHERGMLHRDISPDNILVDRAGEVILIDFGAARQQITPSGKAMSALRVVKDSYSPQEFYIAGSTQNDSSDLYALAATFYHVISGQTAPNSQERLVAIAEAVGDPYAPLAGRFPGYPDGFLEAVDHAMKVLPKERIQTANAWIDLIDKAPSDKIVALRPGREDGGESALPASSGTMPDVELVDLGKAGDVRKRKLIFLSSAVALLAIAAAVTLLQFRSDAEDVLTDGAPEQVAAPEPVAALAPEPVPEPVVPNVETPKVEMAPVEATAAVDAPAEEIPPQEVESEEVVADRAEGGAADVADLGAADQSPEIEPPSVEQPSVVAASAPEPIEATEVIVAEVAPKLDVAAEDAAPAPKASEAPISLLPRQITREGWHAVTPFVTEGIMISGKSFPQISEVTAVVSAPENAWIAPGVIIYSVNGKWAYDIPDIGNAMLGASDVGDTPLVYAGVRIKRGSGAALEEQTLAVPLRRDIEMVTGVTLAVQMVEGQWQTIVAGVPVPVGPTDGHVQVGDVLAVETQTGTVLQATNSFDEAIAALVDGNRLVAMFSASRAGQDVMVTMPLAQTN